MIATIENAKRLNTIGDKLTFALHNLAHYITSKQDAAVDNICYRAVEKQAKVIAKAEDTASGLYDAIVDANAAYIEALNVAKQQYEANKQALTNAHAADVTRIEAKIADAAQALVKSRADYDKIIDRCDEEFGVYPV